MTIRRLPKDIRDAVAAMEPQIKRAFLAAFADMSKWSDTRGIAAAIQAGDVEGAIGLMRLDRTALAPIDAAVTGAYARGGNDTVAGMRPRVALGFDTRTDRAVNWAQDMSSRLVTEIVDDQRTMTRETIARGVQSRRKPRAIALDLVGRVNRVTGRREGGFIGLTSGQAKWADDARMQLEAGDWNGYMRRELRNRSFDRLIARAERDGRELTDDEIDRVIGAYRRNILRYRGEAIASTEALSAIRAGKHEAYAQAVANGRLRDDQILREWIATGDRRTRDSHVAMQGETLRGMAALWNVEGSLMHWPADTSLGALARHTINCRCYEKFTVLA